MPIFSRRGFFYTALSCPFYTALLCLFYEDILCPFQNALVCLCSAEDGCFMRLFMPLFRRRGLLYASVKGSLMPLL